MIKSKIKSNRSFRLKDKKPTFEEFTDVKTMIVYSVIVVQCAIRVRNTILRDIHRDVVVAVLEPVQHLAHRKRRDKECAGAGA